MKKKWLLAASLFGALTLAACSNDDVAETSANDNSDAEVVKIAQNVLPNIPFSYLDESDKMVGYTVDYLQLLDDALEEYVFEYEQLDQEAMLIGVETGKYDLAANFYLKNPDREAKYLFAENSYGFTISGLATKSDRTDINSLDDMAGKSLTPMSPTGGTRIIIDDYNEKHTDNPILIENIEKISYAESLQMVADGKHDAFFVNLNTFDSVNAELNLDVKMAKLISKEPIWLLFNRDNTELAAAIDEVTAELLANGTLTELSEKWFEFDFFQDINDVNEAYQF